jgi:hypothetical protein
MDNTANDFEKAKIFLRQEVERRDRRGFVENDTVWASGSIAQGHLQVLLVWGKNAAPQVKGFVVMNRAAKTILVLDSNGGELARHQYQ